MDLDMNPDARPDRKSEVKYKLMAVDIDGTLLNNQGLITEATRNAIRLGVESGLIFTISTGRPIQGVEHFNKMLGLDLPYITYNGSMVVMGKSRDILYEQKMDPADAKCIYGLGLEYGATVIVWAHNILYVNKLNEDAMLYGKGTRQEALLMEEPDRILESGVSKILWIDTVPNIDRALKEVGGRLSGNVNYHTSNPIYLEFVDKKASKAIAMEKLGEHFGIRREEMIAVGDGFNDLSMIEYAGLGVAMANAVDEIKDKADYVTLSNEEDGVAHVIRKFVLRTVA
jgi:Cof subfamily protein (haloacid dehalogenase superfamily)